MTKLKEIKIHLLHQEAPMQCGISLFPNMSPELTVPWGTRKKNGKTAGNVVFFGGSLDVGWYGVLKVDVGYNRQQILSGLEKHDFTVGN